MAFSTWRGIIACIAPWLVVAAIVSHAAAQTPEQFYKGHVVTIIAPTAPGGAYDINARLVARHIGRFIPGQPNVVVENLPGAGGLLLANKFANTTQRDGSVIGIIERGTPQLPFEGDLNAKFDPLQFNWLGSLSSYANDAYLLLVNSSHTAKQASDLKKPGIIARLGGDTPGSTNLTFAILARDLLHLNVRLVRGYPGAASVFLAMQNGEVDGQIIGLGATRGAQPALWNNGNVRPLVQFGRASRLAELPDVPTARELITDPNDLALLEFAEIPFFIALPLAAPPGVPPDRVAALRTAFMNMVKDPAFLEDARKANFELSPIDGDAVRGYIAQMSATPKDVVKHYADMIANARD